MDELLRRIFADNEASVSPDAAKWFWEFLEHNELGLAFEVLISAIEKSGKPVSSETWAAIEKAGNAMKVKPS